DGHDQNAVAQAIRTAKAADRPTMIACRTIIGYGAPNVQGTSATHGAALGDKEVAAAREHMGWTSPPFEIPGDIMSAWRSAGARGASAFQAWQGRMADIESGKR